MLKSDIYTFLLLAFILGFACSFLSVGASSLFKIVAIVMCLGLIEFMSFVLPKIIESELENQKEEKR